MSAQPATENGFNVEAYAARRQELDAAVSAGVEIEASTNELYAALNRAATQAKYADWNKAIELLRRAKALQGDLYDDTRLAKFLQEAGRPDEAFAEIQWLVERSGTWAAAYLSHQPATVRQRQRLIWLGEVYRAALLIAERADRQDLVQEFDARQQQLARLLDSIKPLAEADDQQRRSERT